MKNNFFKQVLLSQLVVLLAFYGFKSVFTYQTDDSYSNILFEPYEMYFSISLPAILLVLAILLVFVFRGVIGNEDTNDSVKENSSSENFWKGCFYTNLAFATGFIIYGLIDFVVYQEGIALNRLFSNDNIEFYWSVGVTLVIIFSFIIGALLLTVNSFWNTNKVFSIAFVILSLLFFVGPFAFATFISISSDNARGRETHYPEMEGEAYPATEEVVEAIEEAAAADEGSDEPDDTFYNFQNANYHNVDTGNYFADLWSNQENDKQIVAKALTTYLGDYLELHTKQSLFDVKSNSSYEYALSNKDKFVSKIASKINRKAQNIEEAFDSYQGLIYRIVTTDAYYNTPIRLYIKTLLCAHDDIYVSDEKLTLENINALTKIMNIDKTDDLHYSFDAHQFFPYMRQRVSNRMYTLINSQYETNQTITGANLTDESKGVIVWAYSFWLRRRSEFNDTIVYKILKKLNEHYEKD